MKLRHHIPLIKCKLFKPCKKILQLFKFKLRRPLFIRSLRFHHRKHNIRKSTHEGRRSKIFSFFHSLREKREMDRVTELTSFSESTLHHKAPHPSPLTPAYIRMSGVTEKEASDRDDVEDACRSFEKYLMDLIVEEGKMRDLVDVEELLYCWQNLRSPVFIDLVCRFYGELCKDLFSSSCQNDMGNTQDISYHR